MNSRSEITGQRHLIVRLACLAALGFLTAGLIRAEDKPQAEVPPSTPQLSGGRVLEFQAVLPSSAVDSTPSSFRPPRGEQQPVSAEIRAQLLKFESARDAYLKRQRELSQQLKGAGEEQRKAVRDQLKGLREQWLEQSLQFRREARSRIADLKTDLPQYEGLRNGKPALDSKPDRRLK